MRTRRTLFASVALFAANALAHPGHDAPPVHAHDVDELIAIAAAILVAAIAAAGLVAVRRARRK